MNDSDNSSQFSDPGKRVVRSEDLFQSGREIFITHGEATYRLQITKSGKLILNK